MESIPDTTGPAVLDPTAALSQDAREKLEKYIEAEEGEFNRLSGPIGLAITVIAVCVSFFHLYAAFEIVPAHVLRPAHVGMVLFLCYLLFPAAHRFRDAIRWWWPTSPLASGTPFASGRSARAPGSGSTTNSWSMAR